MWFMCASLSLLCLVESAIWKSSEISNYTLPSDFMLGVSTAAFQIEGGWNEGGKGESMWDTYIHKHPEYTQDRSNGDIAADSYHRWKEDIAMIKYLGVKHYRMSISWPRLLPKGTDHYISKDGARYYRKIFEELRRANITVLVTLFHWDLPTPLMDLGGWSNPKMVEYFEDYARIAFTLFGDIVKIWTTLNEPHQHCYNGYGGTNFVPALNSHGVAEYLCSHYSLLAHARAYHLYDTQFRSRQQGKIGLTLDAFWAEPKNSSKAEDQKAADRYLQMHLGLYAHPIYSETGDYPPSVRESIDSMSKQQGYTRSRLPYFSPEEVQMIRGSSDFFGLNHYTTFLMSPSEMEDEWKVPSMDHDTAVRVEQNPIWPKTGPVWFTVYPAGFRKVLNWISRTYGRDIPIIVTENGLGDYGAGGLEDYDRVSYYNKYIYQLMLAKFEDRCNIQGYFAWTLMDDFEWLDGYVTKFGLFHVNFEDPKRTRTPKLSAKNYREIIRTRRINFNFVSKPKSNPHNRI